MAKQGRPVLTGKHAMPNLPRKHNSALTAALTESVRLSAAARIHPRGRAKCLCPPSPASSCRKVCLSLLVKGAGKRRRAAQSGLHRDVDDGQPASQHQRERRFRSHANVLSTQLLHGRDATPA